MVSTTGEFGAKLRERRQAAGLSIAQLAKQVHFSKGHLSKIENGHQTPTAALARLCDAAVGAGGELVAMVGGQSRAAEPAPEADLPLWLMTLDPTGAMRFVSAAEAPPTTGPPGLSLSRGGRPAQPDERIVPMLRASFESTRQFGMAASPLVVFPMAVSHVYAICALAKGSHGPLRAELLVLASRVAEYAGWMCQEAGNEPHALWWIDYAVHLAGTADDHTLHSFALFRQAELALYRQDPLATIELARRAQADPLAGPRVLGLAARCEAQGHALAGDLDSYQRALERASVQLAIAAGEPGGLTLGSTNSQVSLDTGWSLYDLGHPAQAAEVLDGAVGTIPETARRARARYGARRVLAHATNGEVDHACELLRSVLDDATQVDSATVRVDLRQLAKTLSRWRTHPPVRDLYPHLTAALRDLTA